MIPDPSPIGQRRAISPMSDAEYRALIEEREKSRSDTRRAVPHLFKFAIRVPPRAASEDSETTEGEHQA
jgi:hypothetical protein